MVTRSNLAVRFGEHTNTPPQPMAALCRAFRARRVVLDFDGTLTKVDDEARPVVRCYKEDTAKCLGTSIHGISKAWQAAEAKILASPSKFGWVVGGCIVAPAYADPYIMARAVANELLDQFGKLLGTEERNVFLNGLFQSHYSKGLTVFRENALEFLCELHALVPTFIVTNSDTAAVNAKLDALSIPATYRPEVLGNAKKYLLDPNWAEMPESMAIEGLDRPIFLRRKMYSDVLDSIAQRQGISRAEILVMGDIFELDHTVQYAIGAPIVMIDRPSTPPFERNAVLGYSGGGFVVSDLPAAFEAIRSTISQ